MPTPPYRPAADPLDQIDRFRTVDGAMEREDRADTPGQRSDEPPGGRDIYTDAARELSEESPTTDVGVLEDHEGSRVDLESAGPSDLGSAADDLQPLDPPAGADDDDPIDETERAGDDRLP